MTFGVMLAIRTALKRRVSAKRKIAKAALVPHRPAAFAGMPDIEQRDVAAVGAREAFRFGKCARLGLCAPLRAEFALTHARFSLVAAALFA